MLDIDFDDGMINKLAEIICGDDYHEKFCEDKTLTKCPVYRTTGQLYEFFQDLIEIKDEGIFSSTFNDWLFEEIK